MRSASSGYASITGGQPEAKLLSVELNPARLRGKPVGAHAQSVSVKARLDGAEHTNDYVGTPALEEVSVLLVAYSGNHAA